MNSSSLIFSSPHQILVVLIQDGKVVSSAQAAPTKILTELKETITNNEKKFFRLFFLILFII